MFGRILMVAVLIVSLTGVASATLQLGIPETILYGAGGVAPNNLGIYPAVQDISSNMTIAFWVKADPVDCATTYHRLIGSCWDYLNPPEVDHGTGFEVNYTSDATNHSIVLALNTLEMNGGPGGGNQLMTIPNAGDGNLHHVAWVITDDESPLGPGNGTVYKYLDGLLLTAAQDFHEGAQSYIQGAGFDNNNSKDLVIGAASYMGLVANFEMGDLRIYDTTLSASEVLALVPEPMTMSLMAIGGIALLRRRR